MALTLDQVIEAAEAEFAEVLDTEHIHGAEEADERATELACAVGKRFGYDTFGDDCECIISALCFMAGERFPSE